MFREEGIDAVIMPAASDNPVISHVEQKKEGLKFLRIDTDLNAAFKEEVKEDDEEFKKTSEEPVSYTHLDVYKRQVFMRSHEIVCT